MATVKQLEGRLDDLEGALDDERKDREKAGALDDVELEEIQEKLANHENQLAAIWRRLQWVERRLAPLGRPRSRKKKG